MGHPQGQGPLRHTRVAEAPDTGTVTGEATITGPQIIRQSLISFRVDQPVPVIQMFKEIIEIKGIKEGNVLSFLESSFDLILGSSLSMKIQIMVGKITENLRFKSLLQKVKKKFVLLSVHNQILHKILHILF